MAMVLGSAVLLAAAPVAEASPCALQYWIAGAPSTRNVETRRALHAAISILEATARQLFDDDFVSLPLLANPVGAQRLPAASHGIAMSDHAAVDTDLSAQGRWTLRHTHLPPPAA